MTRVLVRDGEVWRPIDDRPEDREAREAVRTFMQSEEGKALGPWRGDRDGLYELVEEHHGVCCSNAHRVGCACPAGWPRKTLRRVGDA